MKKDEEKLLNYIKILADKSKYKIILRLMNGEQYVMHDVCRRLLGEKL